MTSQLTNSYPCIGPAHQIIEGFGDPETDSDIMPEMPSEDHFCANLHVVGVEAPDTTNCTLCEGDFHPGGSLWHVVPSLPFDADSPCRLIGLPCGCSFSHKQLLYLIKTKRIASCPCSNEQMGCNMTLFFLKVNFTHLFESYISRNPVLRDERGGLILPWEQDDEEERILALSTLFGSEPAEVPQDYHKILYWRDLLPVARPKSRFVRWLTRWLKHFDWEREPFIVADGVRIKKVHVSEGMKTVVVKLQSKPVGEGEFWTRDFYAAEGREPGEKVEVLALVEEMVKQIRIQAGILKETKQGEVVDDKPFAQWTDAEKRLYWLVWIFVTWPLMRAGLDVVDKRAALPGLNCGSHF